MVVGAAVRRTERRGPTIFSAIGARRAYSEARSSLDQQRQRVGEVPIETASESVTFHDDSRPKAIALLSEEVSKSGTLLGREQRSAMRVSLRREEIAFDSVPVERFDASGDRRER